MLDRLSRKTICRTTRLAPRHARCVASFTCCYTVCGTGQLRTGTTRAKLWLQRLGDGLSPLPPLLPPPPPHTHTHTSPCCCAGKSSSLCNTNSRASFSGEANVVVVPFSQQCKVSVTSFSPLNMLSLLGCGVGAGEEVRSGGGGGAEVRGGILY